MFIKIAFLLSFLHLYKKPKQKIIYFCKTKKEIYSLVIALIFVVFGCVFPNFSYAQAPTVPPNYVSGGITITTNILVNGKNDNYVKVLKGQPILFSVVLKFGDFVDDQGVHRTQLNLNSDTFDLKTTTGGRRPIKEAGVGLDIVGTGNTCQKKTVYSTILVGSTAGVDSCNFPPGTNKISGSIVNSNTPYEISLSIPSNDATKLTSWGLDRNCERGGATPCLGIYPYLNLDLVGGSVNVAVAGAGKDIYIQTFNTQAELDAAQRPNIPGYGSNTGSVASDSRGNAILDLINRIIGAILGLLQELIYAIFFWLVAPLIQALLSIHPYTDTFVAVIYPGWEVVRNLCNIFFILALIIIAMATLFRVDSYQFRALLVQLILAALLVNFSLVIGQAVLGLADTVQAQFLPANVTVVRSLAADLMVNSYRQDVYKSSFASQGTFSATVKPIFLLAMSLGSFFVFCAIAAFLFIRIIALWLLLLISPIAYAVGVLPSTSHYRSEWWQNFLKYAFFTPIMAFFLNMAAVISNASQKIPVLQAINDTTTANSYGDSSLAVFVFKVGSNLLLLVFLIAALKVADQAGIYGASGITSLAQKGIFAPLQGAGFLGKKLGGYVGRKYTDFTTGKYIAGEKDKKTLGRSLAFAVLNPVAVAKGWVKRGEKLKESSKAKAEATGMMVVEQRLTHGHKIIPRVQQHAKAEADEYVKDFSILSRERQVQLMQDIIQMGNSKEAKDMKRGLETAMMSRGFIDDAIQDGTTTKSKVVIDPTTGEKQFVFEKNPKTGKYDYSQILQKMLKNQKFKIAEPNFETQEENEDWYIDETDGKYKMRYDFKQQAALQEALFGLHDQEAMRMMAEEGEKYGKETLHPEYMAVNHFDYDTDQYGWSIDMEKQGKMAGEAFMASEANKATSRNTVSAVYMARRGRGGKNRPIFGKVVQKPEVENITFSQGRNPNNLAFGQGEVSDGVNFDSTDGSMVIGPQTYLTLKEEVRQGLQESIIANYLRSSGAAITGGSLLPPAIRGATADLKYIQQQQKLALTNPAITDATIKTELLVRKHLNPKLLDQLIANNGIKITVLSPKDMPNYMNDEATPALRAALKARNLTQVNDVIGQVGAKGANVAVTNNLEL